MNSARAAVGWISVVHLQIDVFDSCRSSASRTSPPAPLPSPPPPSAPVASPSSIPPPLPRLHFLPVRATSRPRRCDHHTDSWPTTACDRARLAPHSSSALGSHFSLSRCFEPTASSIASTRVLRSCTAQLAVRWRHSHCACVCILINIASCERRVLNYAETILSTRTKKRGGGEKKREKKSEAGS